MTERKYFKMLQHIYHCLSYVVRSTSLRFASTLVTVIIIASVIVFLRCIRALVAGDSSILYKTSHRSNLQSKHFDRSGYSTAMLGV